MSTAESIPPVPLDEVRAALPPDIGGDPHTVRLDRTLRRRRSTLHFLETATDPSRWVLKLPHPGVRQADLAPPLSAKAQYDALVRLHGHLTHLGMPTGTPEPVAYLPDIDGYLMRFVAGPTLAARLRPAAVMLPQELLRAVDGAARMLRSVHRIAGPLPPREGAVVLHGDFAPENLLLGAEGLCCLEPELTEVGDPAVDVARFVLMLSEAPLFVAAEPVPGVRRLRRRAIGAFVAGYYGTAPPDHLSAVLAEAAAARWQTRRSGLDQRRPRLHGARARLLDAHFARLLAEWSSPEGGGRTSPRHEPDASASPRSLRR